MNATAAEITSGSSPRNAESQRLYDQLFERIAEVSTLPTAAMRIIEIAGDPNSSGDDLLHAVQSDPALATRVMRTVNSAYYALRGTIADLKNAIMLLGFKEVRNLALTAYVAKLFQQTAGYGPYRRERLWNHLVGVASAARLIARSTGKDAPEEAYLAGLLHDLGLILIDQYLHRRFCQVIDLLSDERPTSAAEWKVLGFDHTELGERIARGWHFPEQITAAIRYHHDPPSYSGAHRATLHAVVLANYLASRKGLTSLGVCNVVLPPESVFHHLGMTKDELSALWGQLEEELERAQLLARM